MVRRDGRKINLALPARRSGGHPVCPMEWNADGHRPVTVGHFRPASAAHEIFTVFANLGPVCIDTGGAHRLTFISLNTAHELDTTVLIDNVRVVTHGTLTLASNGDYTYVVDNNNPEVQALAAGQTLVDTFGYTVTDNHGAISHSTLAISVHGTPDVYALHQGDAENHITGFTAGIGGDSLDIRDLLSGQSVNSGNLAQFMQLANVGNDTAVMVDADGSGPAAAVEVATLIGINNLLLGDLVANHNLIFA